MYKCTRVYIVYFTTCMNDSYTHTCTQSCLFIFNIPGPIPAATNVKYEWMLNYANGLYIQL